MADRLAHRGPDGAGTWQHNEFRVAFGHRRLSIVDLSAAGAQPMTNEDGSVVITYNGEIYNHQSLRAELEAKGHIYRSSTDTETIVHLYEEEGPACVERLDGMFAFAIWDARHRRLVLARDRIGVKPLFYLRLPGGLVFASEIKAILCHPAVRPELDEQALYDYLTFAFSPSPRSMFRGIHKVAPAECLTIDLDGRITSETYWTPFSQTANEEVGSMSETEIERHTLELLRSSIAKRMMSDVPFGVFLSGGLDSSTNVALMAELSDAPVRTFSTAPLGHPKYDELAPARVVAKRFGTDHHEVLVSESDFAEFLPTLLDHQDEPLSDWTCIPQHFVSKLARDSGTPVVQVGEGADELFHGYKGYADHRRYFVPFQRYLPPLARRALARAAVDLTRRAGRGQRHAEALTDAALSPIPYWGGSICFRGELKRRILGPNLHHEGESLARAELLWDEAERLRPGADLLQKMSYLELKQRLPELLLARLDRIAMLSSVEGRDPFLDHRLVEFVLALSPDMKVRNGTTKYVLKQAVRGLLPAEIVNRKKQGFGTPMAEWLRGDFGQRAEARIADSPLISEGLLDIRPLDGLFAEHRTGRADWSYHLWNVFNVCEWHRRWIAGDARS
jgi:asparagine synthase (glutamine-hydrolysing)